MCEFHFRYKINPKDKLEIKVASWELFEPMGIPWGPDKMQESEAYPGKLKESGIGLTYQRLLWKGLFVQIEILPLWKTYLDENKEKIDDGFKLYTSYHLGYHIPLLKNRFLLSHRFTAIIGQLIAKLPKASRKEKANGITISSLNPTCISVSIYKCQSV